jgi:ribose 1,5-bisphosphate isomerase
MDIVDKTVRDIKNLKIQGAREISIAGLEALAKGSQKIKSKNKKEFEKELFKIAKKLSKSRPTEPALRNSLAYILYQIQNSKTGEIGKLKGLVNKKCQDYIKELEVVHDVIAEIATRGTIQEGKILTHCHSTSVVATLKKAWNKKRKISVICTETRPLYQGVKTAKELSEHGIPTTLILDSAVRAFIKDVDLVVLGADTICANGAVINKIGSSQIATIAREQRKTLVVIAGSYKFDPITVQGYFEPIEERDPREIIDPKKLPKVKIRNPAFDVIPPDYIDAIITDLGVLNPGNAYNIFKEKFEWFEKDHAVLKKLMS